MDKKKSIKKDGTGRTRNWTLVVYPESAPEQWRSILDDEHIEWVESPLHDKDINADKTIKKPHWHILLIYESVKTYEQVKELTDKLNCPIPQKCASPKGLVRYMCHMDNPEKVQYSKLDIIGHGGADVSELLKPSSSERYVLIGEMINYVKDNNIIEFCDLAEYALKERFDDWFPLLCDNSSYIMGSVLKSYRHRRIQSSEVINPIKIDEETGEVLE